MKRLLFLPLLVTFAGCGVTASSRPSPTAVRSVAAPASKPAPKPKPKPTAYVPDRIIASRTATIDDADLELAIMHLDRSGATVSLGLKLSGAHTYYSRVDRIFDDGQVQPIRNSDSRENRFSVDGIYLLDRVHGRKYLVARDPDGHCICDAGLAGAKLSEGSMDFGATYGAPPPDVTAVDVVVPRFGTFANVPLG